MNDVFPVKFYNFLYRPKNLAPLCLCASAPLREQLRLIHHHILLLWLLWLHLFLRCYLGEITIRLPSSLLRTGTPRTSPIIVSSRLSATGYARMRAAWGL